MYERVTVRGIQTLSATPSLGAFIGGSRSQDVIDSLNSRWGGGSGVIFGQAGDPYAEKYSNLMTNVISQLNISDQIIQDGIREISTTNTIQAITSEEALANCPVGMQLPILMYEPVRELFEQDRIYGFGFDKEYLPKEDVFGRLISNGKAELTGQLEGEKVQDEFVWEWKSDDPDLDDDELDAIAETREWIDKWLFEQMAVGGDYKDPTDLAQTIKLK